MTHPSAVKHILLIAACALLLLPAACGRQTEPTDTVESLMIDAERLKDLRTECKSDHAKVGDALCSRAAEATRRRFMGGGTQYAPWSIASPTAATIVTPAPTPRD